MWLWFAENGEAASIVSSSESSNKISEVDVEILIMGLKDVYDKKTKKTNEGLEYRLENSEVTVVIRASDEITSVRAYTRRCAEAAIRTHDTIGRWCNLGFLSDNVYCNPRLILVKLRSYNVWKYCYCRIIWYIELGYNIIHVFKPIGPVELGVNILQNDLRCRIVSVDLGSVYKTQEGDPVYWLEKAEVMQRNKWEMVVAMEFSSGLKGAVTSEAFRVTTKASYKMRRNGGLCSTYYNNEW